MPVSAEMLWTKQVLTDIFEEKLASTMMILLVFDLGNIWKEQITDKIMRVIHTLLFQRLYFVFLSTVAEKKLPIVPMSPLMKTLINSIQANYNIT